MNLGTFADASRSQTGQAPGFSALPRLRARWRVFDAPRGTGPYAHRRDAEMFFASLAGNYLAHIDLDGLGSRLCRAKPPTRRGQLLWNRAMRPP